MDNVWISTKGMIWDAVIDKMKRDNIWGTVVKRNPGPSADELRQLKSDRDLVEKIQPGHESSYTKMLEKQYRILEVMIRKTDWGTDRYNASSIHELGNRARIYYEYYRLILMKKAITLVIFVETPHMGPSIILYEVAKSYGIKILILEQSKFPGKFHHYSHLDDWGIFASSKILGNQSSYPLEKKVEKDWFYMKKNRGRPIVPIRKKIFEKVRYGQWINRQIENNDFLRLFRELAIRSRRPQAFFRFYTEREYKKMLKAHTTRDPVDFTRNYVYLPLHLQPEKVSTIWSGVYSDQALVAERLSKLLPEDWYIYMKESPFQRGALRGPLFFERIKQVPNLVLVPNETDTFELTRHSRFVATVAGTVGWEAITGGKSALIFGWGAWYRDMPGVYSYREGMDIDDLVHVSINHGDLEKRVAWLLNRCGSGIISDLYMPSVPDFSMTANTNDVASSLKRILYQARTKS